MTTASAAGSLQSCGLLTIRARIRTNTQETASDLIAPCHFSRRGDSADVHLDAHEEEFTSKYKPLARAVSDRMNMYVDDHSQSSESQAANLRDSVGTPSSSVVSELILPACRTTLAHTQTAITPQSNST